jgi:hypothetical protein
MKPVYLLFLMSVFITTVILIALPIQIQGQPVPEYECALPNSPSSSVANEDSSCNKRSTSNITADNCFGALQDGPIICNQPQTPFVPSGIN